MESEVELNDAIMELHVVATAPELYHVLIELNSVQTLLQLLNHENTGTENRVKLIAFGAKNHFMISRIVGKPEMHK